MGIYIHKVFWHTSVKCGYLFYFQETKSWESRYHLMEYRGRRNYWKAIIFNGPIWPIFLCLFSSLDSSWAASHGQQKMANPPRFYKKTKNAAYLSLYLQNWNKKMEISRWIKHSTWEVLVLFVTLQEAHLQEK